MTGAGGRLLGSWWSSPLAVLGLLVLVAGPALAQTAPGQDPRAEFLTVPARDEVPLSICVIRPEGDGPFPTVLEWTGYTISDTTTGPAGGCPPQLVSLKDRLVDDGYVYVAGNPRGVGASGGQEWGWWGEQDGLDGADVVEWIAAQPWSNGNVGIAGCSGSAMSGIFAAAENPPALKAAALSCFTVDSYRGSQYPGGILAWTWMVLAGRPGHDLGVIATTEMLQRGDLDFTTRPIAPVNLWSDIHAHDTYDEFWTHRQVVDRLAGLPPTYAFGSWADFFGVGALELARLARPQDRVLVHPSGHGSSQNVLGPDGFEDRTHAFFDHHLRGEPLPFADEPTIRFWELDGADNTLYGAAEISGRFRDVDTWPPADVEYQPWFLRTGRTNTQASLNDGFLRPEPPDADEPGDPFTYPAASPGSVHDHRQTFVGQNYDLGIEAAGGAVTYTSEPLAELLHLAGPVTLDFWATSTAADTDWVVRLIDVPPDGQPLDITNGWLKASHRALDPARTEVVDGQVVRAWHTHVDPQPVPAGEPVNYQVELWDVASEVPAGHRLKVSISSQEAFFFTQKIGPAVNTVLHGPDHPSRIVLPVRTGVVEQPAAAPAEPAPPPTPVLPATGPGRLVAMAFLLVLLAATRPRARA